jgi:putative thioredoxin
MDAFKKRASAPKMTFRIIASTLLMETYVTITAANAKAQLIDESFKRPVLVDFWADWCAPCKNLMPLLEKLAADYGGAFLLAKVNADEQRMIAAQFGVQSLPTVILMKDGQPVDGFVGALPEKQIREFLDKHLPKPWDALFEQGQVLMQAGDVAAAMTVFREAYQDSSKRADIACALAETLIQLKRLDEAKEILDGIKMVDQDTRYHQVFAQWELACTAQKAPEITELEARLAQTPEDAGLALQLAVQYSQHAYTEEALNLLYSHLRKNLTAEEGAVRRAYTDILATLPKGDPLAVSFQRKLYALLY